MNIVAMDKAQATTLLQKLGQARDELLAGAEQVLKSDPRVTAVWLSGSYGRGEADEWSDLDLHVTVEDEALPAVWEEHAALFALVGRPILMFGGMFSNSMPGGRFWLVQYAPYMLEIDWNIGPTQDTTRPAASHVLFDRIGIPITPAQAPVTEAVRRNEAQTQLAFFWAMAPLAIKFVGRGHTRLAVKQADLLEGAYIRLWHVLYQPEHLQKDAFHQNRPLETELDIRLPRFGPVIDLPAALATIRALCEVVTDLHPALAELGATVDDEVMQEVAALAKVAEIVARTGGSRPLLGSRR